jgi:hypothetical protein
LARRSKLRKITDYTTRFRYGGGIAVLREEVWVSGGGQVVQYNLALVARHLSGIDNGRILGYDNAHGEHERHFMGKVKPATFTSYGATAKRFFREVEAWRKRQ